MATALDAIRSAYALAAREPNDVLGLHWLNERFAELVGRARIRALRRVGVLTSPAVVNDGTVDVDRGSRVVTGDSDAQAAWLGKDLIGRHFQAATNWYEIIGQTASTLILATPYAESDVDDGSHRIVLRFPKIPAEVRTISCIYSQRMRHPLSIIGLYEMDLRNPEREYAEGGPEVAIEHGEHDDGTKKIELYPYSTEDENLPFTYWTKPPLFQIEQQLPGFLDTHIMAPGILASLYTWLANEAAAREKIEVAGFYLNAKSREETKWEGKIEDAIKNDRGLDDLALLIAASGRGFGPQATEIRTARDEWVARGGSLY